jgi:hypothetical protein
MEIQRQAGKLAKGGGEKGVGRRGKNAGLPATRIPTLADQGVDRPSPMLGVSAAVFKRRAQHPRDRVADELAIGAVTLVQPVVSDERV